MTEQKVDPASTRLLGAPAEVGCRPMSDPDRVGDARHRQAVRRVAGAPRGGLLGASRARSTPWSVRTARASRPSCASSPASCRGMPARSPSTGSASNRDTPQVARRLGIRAVHQEFSLVPQLSVAENLLLGELPTRYRGIVDWPEAQREAAADARCAGFPRASTRRPARRPAGRLAATDGGDRQGPPGRAAGAHPRRALGRALERRSWSACSPCCAASARRARTVVYVSHRLDEVFRIADRITVLKDGERRGHGVARGHRPAGAHPHDGRPAAERDLPRRGRSQPGPRLLELDRLSGPGFHDVDLSLGRGEIVGLFGLVGAGRTELARGHLRGGPGAAPAACAWTVPRTHPGRPPMRSVRVWRCSARTVPATGSCLPACVLDNLTLASFSRKLSYLGVIARSPAASRSQGRRSRSWTSGRRSWARPSDALSGGNQQKVVFGKWLLHGAHGPDPRRADARRRRRHQGPDLPGHRRAGRRGPGGAAHLVGPAGDHRHERPHRGHARRAAWWASCRARPATEERLLAHRGRRPGGRGMSRPPGGERRATTSTGTPVRLGAGWPGLLVVAGPAGRRRSRDTS